MPARRSILLSLLVGIVIQPALCLAHGFVGDRFFPPTISTDDPFAVDELALPEVSGIGDAASGGNPAPREIDWGFEFDKEILPHFALGISDDFISQKQTGNPSIYGWDNIELTAKYQIWQNDPHEFILSAGLIADIANAGTHTVADDFSTLSPTVYFGKGFGDLPDSLQYLRPFAITGELGEGFPTSAEAPNTFQWGFAVEYSLPYLQQEVKDVGLPAPFKDMIPLVEFNLSTNENRGTGLTTGTIDPGILWETPYAEFGAEAVLPVNGQTGSRIGFTVNVWIFIDDLFPKIFGHPLFGKEQP